VKAGTTKPAEKRMSDKVTIMCPAHLWPLIRHAAERRLQTPTEFVRQSIVTRLLDDGIDPSNPHV
jgi:hypothetical protein